MSERQAPDWWPFAMDGRLIPETHPHRIVAELRYRRANRNSIKKLVGWLRDEHGITIETSGVWRLLQYDIIDMPRVN